MRNAAVSVDIDNSYTYRVYNIIALLQHSGDFFRLLAEKSTFNSQRQINFTPNADNQTKQRHRQQE